MPYRLRILNQPLLYLIPLLFSNDDLISETHTRSNSNSSSKSNSISRNNNIITPSLFLSLSNSRSLCLSIYIYVYPSNNNNNNNNWLQHPPERIICMVRLIPFGAVLRARLIWELTCPKPFVGYVHLIHLLRSMCTSY